MALGGIHDPEGAKTKVVSFKMAAGGISTIERQTLKFVCFGEIDSGRPRIDTAPTAGGKQIPSFREEGAC